jgi:Protein of unknown function (DUF2505)
MEFHLPDSTRQTGGVRFEAIHRFHGSPSAVADLLADPQFYCDLDLPDVGRPTLVDSSTDGPRSRVQLRYEFTGNLDPMVHRLLGQNRLAWIQEVVVDHSADDGQINFSSAADPRRLHGSAHFSLESDGGGCLRRLEGELVVKVPLIGSKAEKQIAPGLLRRLDIEAEALDAALNHRGP